MKTSKLLYILVPVLSAVASVILVVALLFGAPQPHAPVYETLTDENGSPIYGVTVDQLTQCNYLRFAYYTPDEFVKPSCFAVQGTRVDLSTQKNVAGRGTYQFVLYNLNPEDSDKWKDGSAKLDPYLQGDKAWHFSVYLPPIFSACNVYADSTLEASMGAIENYHYIDYSEKQGATEYYESHTKPVTIDLSFYSRRSALSNSFYQRAHVITVHYETKTAKAAFDALPMAGPAQDMEKVARNDIIVLTVLALAAAFMSVILAFACMLKKSLFAVSSAAMSWGVCGFALFKMLLYLPLSAPLFSYVMIPICVGIIVVAAVLSLIRGIKRSNPKFLVSPPIAAVFVAVYFCVPFNAPVLTNPLVWLAMLMLAFAAFSAFDFFAKLERHNVYLTNNLKSEVARQTKDLKQIVKERDKLLRYLSHDLKKPIVSIKKFVAEIRHNETNAENNKALDIIDGKLDGMQSDLVELQEFAKLNFAAEECVNLPIGDVLQNVYGRLAPDCEANGITLRCNTARFAVYAQRNILYSVIDNLVFNAIEHAQCSTITITAVKNGGVCHLTVADNGVGIENEHDIFLPYHTTGAQNENLGLGLYIGRQHMLSMGGDLQYSRTNNKTTFDIILPLA